MGTDAATASWDRPVRPTGGQVRDCPDIVTRLRACLLMRYTTAGRAGHPRCPLHQIRVIRAIRGKNTMDALLTRLNETLTPHVLGELERSTGLDHTRLIAGVAEIGPLVQHGLAELSRTPEGMRQIVELLPPEPQPDPIGHLLHVYVYGSP